MIKDAKGRKWYLRFKQYTNGWRWEAVWRERGRNRVGQNCGDELFATRALAEADARRTIRSRDVIAMSSEYFRRLQLRGTDCQLTIARSEERRVGKESRTR